MDHTTLNNTQASASPADRPLRLVILGATGSIGRSTLDIVAREPERFEVVALVADRNAAALAGLARSVRAGFAALASEDRGAELAAALAGSGIACGAGAGAVLDAVLRPADMVVAAIVGSAGLTPTFAAVAAGRTVALANKECLVCAGELFMGEARRTGATVLPVDSEHNAIFQVLETHNAAEVEKIILTASGGPFRRLSLEAMRTVTAEQALKHPNWDMGSRISIDSATLMNKGLEVIEASHLFPVRHDQLEVLVHPQSVVHGLVQYRDGSLLAQMGAPDMRTPIAHCLAFPQRMAVPVRRLDLASLGTLTFERPDTARFPALRLALEAMRAGGGAPAALNAADEEAVAAFLAGRLGFLDIAAVVEEVLGRLEGQGQLGRPESIPVALDVDRAARAAAREAIARRQR
ncbi:1-deoxy-D-xylulose-5-phosphate reductoisomerase [Polymorphum gilvum]|uniref:1-deoxy-D-xylulose 5-phosphate reductoisomerase n=1 Tax=Polymorphum gilvum (strain LMG 25793 / CGMCC 1.9160 / SL003B-26A1) TaxID=991905 RepID=F2IY21_POLGS|nr:1-deoxy-D-xylulose-5-phosphate reductoisomerase [Polymorphum gilvum]ADZ70524.1 1-deoxy-D-xylulose 5-phosphate reductoisomerase [Polymorphum gilvum SL003B-26A1]